MSTHPTILLCIFFLHNNNFMNRFVYIYFFFVDIISQQLKFRAFSPQAYLGSWKFEKDDF